MEAVQGGKSDAAAQPVFPWRGLLGENLSKRKQFLVTCDIVEPINYIDVVRSPLYRPVAPCAERMLREFLKLVMEIFCHEVNDPLVSGSVVILLHEFERHYPRPPVMCAVSLKSVHIREVAIRAEEAVFPLALKCPFNPHLSLCLQACVIQEIGQGHQAVNPIRTSFPFVSVTA